MPDDVTPEPTAPDPTPTVGRDTSAAPGGRAALARGCRCSVLANAAFRAGAPGETPFVDPACGVHTAPAS